MQLVASGGNPEFAGFWSLLYKVMPNFEDVNFINATSAGLPVQWGQVGLGALAMGLWSLLFLGGAVLLFRKREF